MKRPYNTRDTVLRWAEKIVLPLNIFSDFENKFRYSKHNVA